MKIKQIRETSSEELQAQIAEARKQIVEMKVKKTASDVAKQPLKRRTLRRDVARMMTVLRERDNKESK